ncbi:hypothetical protein [Methylophaga sulfidovorans]|uniref:Uncharacterized protein n=1 Tax=Methylophaga sulfidovorans TaxID=45496 RepID=A0A1I4AES7_9GAMM|nr:hypothetical protein [Methylophaga sulfidovorans]SFK54441.1 hypothetical protein SAMN04488079_11428 [Methylophaga sulfidovorans]
MHEYTDEQKVCESVLNLLRSQEDYDGYRHWEETFFDVCKHLIESVDNWNYLIQLSRSYGHDTHIKTQYLAEALSTFLGFRPFDSALLVDKIDPKSASPSMSFFSAEYHPERPARDDLAMSYNLQRGMDLTRFQQYLEDGCN